MVTAWWEHQGRCCVGAGHHKLTTRGVLGLNSLAGRDGLAACEAAPDDAAIKTELARAEKDLKKNVYGW